MITVEFVSYPIVGILLARNVNPQSKDRFMSNSNIVRDCLFVA